MPKLDTIPYEDNLQTALSDPTAAAHYLDACLKDDDPGVFLLGLRDVADSMGGLGKLSRASKRNRESLYRMLSESGNPSLDSLSAVLRALGLRFAVQPVENKPKPRKRKAA